MKLGWIDIAPWGWWRFMYRSRRYCGIFRNGDGVKPGRWGFYILGFEFGSRNPGNWFGVFLKRIGLWPW
jgi:hypothetical protein